MPLEYRVLESHHAILISASGTVTLADCAGMVAKLLEEPAIEEVAPVLVDARGVTTNVNVREIVHFATLSRMLVKRGMDLIAIVADPGPVLTLARAFELAARALGVHAAVFDTIEEARVWLRIRDDGRGMPGNRTRDDGRGTTDGTLTTDDGRGATENPAAARVGRGYYSL
jgi:hypothetical protein